MNARQSIAIYCIKKAVQFFLTLLILSLAVFYMARLAPGDPLKAYYGEGVERMSTAERTAATERLGLDRPIHAQYGVWVRNALAGDFGISFKYKQEVTKVIGGVYQNTLILGLSAYLLTFSLALLLGCLCALYEDKTLDRVICRIGTVTNCIPSFWISLMLILIFSVTLVVLPSGGAYSIGGTGGFTDRIRHLILPLTVLVISHLWYYAYMVRNKLLNEVRQDYVLLCRTKGLGKKTILFRHCLRNIMPTYISVMAISIPHILGGTYVVEKVFSYPGLGTLCFESAKYHDYNMLLVLSLLTGALVVAANLFAQVLNDRIDPRMRHEGGEDACAPKILS